MQHSFRDTEKKREHILRDLRVGLIPEKLARKKLKELKEEEKMDRLIEETKKLLKDLTP